jgi:KDO2-lipid IV(A) lauroyltransferase
MSKITYWLLYGFVWLFTLLPDFIIYKFSSFVGFLLYYVIHYRKNLVIRNLGCSFPDKRIGEIESIAKKFYIHFADTFIESCMMLHWSGKEATKRMVIKNPEVLDPFYKQGRSVLGVFGHYGSWDLFASFPLQSKYQLYGLYKPIHDSAVDKLFIKLRERYGAEAVKVDQSLQTILRNRNENKLGVYMFIADQRPIPRSIRYWSKFLNQETPILLGIEKIAKKTNFPVAYFDVQKVKRGYYEAEIKIITDDPSKEPELDIVERYLRLLEARIINKPEYWLWSHDRWKHKRFAWEKKYGNFLIERPEQSEGNENNTEDDD